MVLGLSLVKANAQYVRERPRFSLSISVGNPGPPPFSGAIWVGPEWQWRENRYVEVPGYWAHPRRHYTTWQSGEWYGNDRKGYKWRKGRWGRGNDRDHDHDRY